MTAILHDYRPLRPSQAHVRTGPKLKPRQMVTWTNPNTGEVWDELVVEFVYGQSGTALCRGWFGRMERRSGDCLVESRVVRACDVVVTGNADEVVR